MWKSLGVSLYNITVLWRTACFCQSLVLGHWAGKFLLYSKRTWHPIYYRIYEGCDRFKVRLSSPYVRQFQFMMILMYSFCHRSMYQEWVWTHTFIRRLEVPSLRKDLPSAWHFRPLLCNKTHSGFLGGLSPLLHPNFSVCIIFSLKWM